MADLHDLAAAPSDAFERDDAGPLDVGAAWVATPDEADEWRRHLDDEIRPLVEVLGRLRERDLLD